ncbi:hypothetical protein DPMN_158481 [Dreissena polymorpha]|uniref:DUF4371 domain-containing protein n=1 Tax=Dreissena polymorpha TaxID=45954 RepID=A0A9D4EMJ1_DREPO|nr:hypothetical protein DPMN_158481 [Dreissena polymorpha]
MKVDAIKKHTVTSDHKFALAAQNASVSIEQAAIKAAEKEREGVDGLMTNLYYLAKRNEPSSSISDLNKLLVHHSVSRFGSMMRADKSLPYEHHESVRDMLDAIAEVVRRQLIDDIRQSGVFSVMCDESTDASTDKTLIFYIYNLIKTKQRNRLYVSTVNTLMMMTVDTPDISDMNQFNFGRAFDVWAVSKARRFGNKTK